ncbi:MAG: hypothetical protein ABF297_13410 [Thiogranum sp.]
MIAALTLRAARLGVQGATRFYPAFTGMEARELIRNASIEP